MMISSLQLSYQSVLIPLWWAQHLKLDTQGLNFLC